MLLSRWLRHFTATVRTFRGLPLLLLALVLAACQSGVRNGDSISSKPSDPFDYNYCGGVPVYPVIGVNFATLCGPRNQIAVGRYGTLMWLFPAPDGKTALYQGQRKLSIKELKRVSLLAEVVQLADPAPLTEPGAVNYRMGINFSGRPSKRLHAILTDGYSPAHELFQALLDLVPDKPALPVCQPQVAFFDPSLLPGGRRQLSLIEVNNYQRYSNVAE